MISDGTAQFQIVDQKQDGTDIDALKSELEAVKSSLAAVQTAISDAQNFTIIYPNGGTASNPARITTNKRYVEDNPFPGYYVLCITQIQVNDKWGEITWIYTSDSVGVKASQLLPDDKIIVQTGTNSLKSFSTNSGDPFGDSNKITSANCRIIIHKLRKI